jgi:hypothetical protein
MYSKLWGSVVLVCLGAAPALAQDVTVSWRWAKAQGTPAWQLWLTRADTETFAQKMHPLTVLGAPACESRVRAAGGEPYVPDETWCATLACPEPGRYMAMLTAEGVERATDAAEAVTFGIVTTPRCGVVGYEAGPSSPAAASTSPVVPPATSPPTPAAPPLSPPSTPAEAALQDEVVALQRVMEEGERLESTYEQQLTTIQQDYDQAIKEVERTPKGREGSAQREKAYARAKQRQGEAFEAAHARWRTLMEHWQAHLARWEEARQKPQPQPD